MSDSYESERRPIGRHNVERAADPGARRPADEALTWDLDGRMPHAWLDHHGARVSTVDLIGDGLTLFTVTEDPEWSSIGDATGWTASLQVVVVDVETLLPWASHRLTRCLSVPTVTKLLAGSPVTQHRNTGRPRPPPAPPDPRSSWTGR